MTRLFGGVRADMGRSVLRPYEECAAGLGDKTLRLRGTDNPRPRFIKRTWDTRLRSKRDSSLRSE